MRCTARNQEVACGRGSRTCFSLLLLFAVGPVAAQQVADGQILTNIGLNTTSEKTFLLKNGINCPRDTYEFLLTSDSNFVSLPVASIELSKSESTRVRVLFDSKRLKPGTHTANITVNCKDCGRCRADDKTLRVVLTVVADGAAVVDNTVEPPIVEPIIQVDGDEAELQMPNLIGSGLREAVARLTALELQANPEGDAIRRPDLLAVMSQQPAPGAAVEAGDRVTLTSGVRVPDLAGLTAAEARSRLDEIGLLLVASADDAAATASQIPVAGVLVAVGTSVSLILPVAGGISASGAWLTIIVMLVIAAVLIFFWRTFARNQAMPAACIEVRSSLDTGTQRVWSEGNEQQKPVIRVRLTGAAAELSVQGDPAAITEREW